MGMPDRNYLPVNNRCFVKKALEGFRVPSDMAYMDMQDTPITPPYQEHDALAVPEDTFSKSFLNSWVGTPPLHLLQSLMVVRPRASLYSAIREQPAPLWGLTKWDR